MCHLSRQGDAIGGGASNCPIMSTAGSSPTVPERWPCLPPTLRVFLSSPKDISPDPISTRRPSIDSTNQRPDNGMIHCGFGFSCQSPIQPTGSTVMKTVAASLVLAPIHCGAACGAIAAFSNSVIVQQD